MTDFSPIESAVRADPAVEDCAVRLRPSSDDSPLIVAYVQPSGPWNPEAIELSLKARLPGRQLPSAWVPVNRIPLTEDGAPDEVALRDLPVVNGGTLRSFEQSVSDAVFPRGARVRMEDVVFRARPLHLSSLIPEWNADAPDDGDERADSPGGAPLAEPGKMAYSDGGAMRTLPIATVTEGFLKTAADHPDRGVTWVLSRNNETFATWGEILTRARRMLSGLRAHGLRPGDCAILHVSHLPDHFAAFWACVLGGIHPTTVAPAPSYERQNPVLMKLYNAWELLGRPPILANDSLVAAIGGAASVVGAERFVTLSVETLEQESECFEIHRPDPRDAVFYQLTSGSTGTPKCVQITHDGVVCHTFASADFLEYREDDVVLNWLPMDHVVPTLTMHLRDACLGCNEIQVKTDAVLADPLLWLELMDRHRVTHSWAPNFGFRVVSEALAAQGSRGLNLSSLKYLMNAGEQVTARVVEEFLKAVRPFGVPEIAMQPAFGMAEACTCMTYRRNFSRETGAHWVLKSSLGRALMRGEPGEKNACSFVDLGPPIPGVEIRIADREDRLLPEGFIGRLQIRGRVVTPGYFRNEEANRDSFVGDGWFNSGDLGFIVDGSLSLTGREKETIIIRGANFYCYEIEDIVNSVEGVEPSWSAACAVRDGSATDGLAIFFVPSARPDLHRAAVVRAIRSRVSSDLGVTPNCVVPLSREEFPKTTSGKIQREHLKQALSNGRYAERLAELDIDLENANTLPDWFFRTVWRRREPGTTKQVSKSAVLLFDDGSPAAIRLRALLGNRGQTVIRVSPGTEFRRVDRFEYSIPPAAPSGYRRLMDSLKAEAVEFGSIAHLWTSSLQPIPGFQIREEVLEHGVYSLAPLAAALGTVWADRAGRLIVASTQSQTVRAGESIIPENAMAAALVRTLGQELPFVSCRHIDLQAATAEAAQLILDEIDSDDKEPEIAFREGSRLTPRLNRVEFDAASIGDIPLRAGSIYLVSGGGGAIAVELASWLIEKFQVRILAIGRGEKSDKDFPRHFASGPDFFRYERADVSSPGDLRSAVEKAKCAWGSELDGVFHLAGEYHERTVAEETRESFATVFLPKIYGAAALHSLLEEERGRLFVNFSSVTQAFGGAMIGAYSAANRYLDAMSRRQRAESGIKSYCLDWSTWDSLGMSKDYPAIGTLRARGYGAISIRRGMHSLHAALCRPPENLMVGLDDSRPFLRRISASQPVAFSCPVAVVEGAGGTLPPSVEIDDVCGRPVPCKIRPAGPADASPEAAAASLNPTERRIAALWKELLRADSIGPWDSFFELGGNSLLLVRMGARIEQDFGKAAGAGEIFRYPTIRQLAGYLDEAGPPKHQAGMEAVLERASSRRARTKARFNRGLPAGANRPGERVT